MSPALSRRKALRYPCVQRCSTAPSGACLQLSASCGTALPGWPCNKELDDLRTAWLKEGNPAKRKELLDKFHTQAYEALPYINAGQYSPAVAVRKEIKGAERLHNGLPLVWFLDK